MVMLWSAVFAILRDARAHDGLLISYGTEQDDCRSKYWLAKQCLLLQAVKEGCCILETRGARLVGAGQLALLFEAKGIQSWILAGGRLRYLVGASAVVDSLCAKSPPKTTKDPSAGHTTDDRTGLEGLLDACLAACGLVDVQFLRRAGGVFTFVVDENARSAVERFQDIWTFAVQSAAPGLSFIIVLGEGLTVADAMKHVREQSAGRRSFPSFELPLASPLVRRVARTGRPAIAASKHGEDLDHALFVKERAGKAINLTEALVPGSNSDDWPVDMEEDFPFLTEDRTVAIFHADVNRLGEVVTGLGGYLGGLTSDSERSQGILDKKYIQVFYSFSEAMGRAMRSAVGRAGTEIEKRRKAQTAVASGKATIYPARPIVLGGDDLTIILRADVALDFAKSFLAAFALEAREKCAGIEGLDQARIAGENPNEWHALPRLTACGGLVFCGAKQPFSQCLSLAESLCKYAKKIAKKSAPHRWDTVPTALAFHRLSGSLIDNYEEILETELSARYGPERLLTAQPYLVSEDNEGRHDEPEPPLACLEDLISLANAINGEGFARGSIREIGTLVYELPAEANARFERMRLMAERREPLTAWNEFQSGLEKLLDRLGRDRNDRLFAAGKTPVLDAIALAQIMRRGQQ